MWPHEKLKILVPRTPPDPPLPPLTPPRGPGGPKMAKMHSLKSIDDNLCQKSHFWGVKKIDLFFHSEYTKSSFWITFFANCSFRISVANCCAGLLFGQIWQIAFFQSVVTDNVFKLRKLSFSFQICKFSKLRGDID